MRPEKTVPVSQTELCPLIEQIVRSGGTAEFTATGNSMRPMLLDKRSIVRISAPQHLRRGDVVLFCASDGKYLLHRIIAFSPDGTVCCRGDGNLQKECGIRREKIIGTVTAFCRTRWWYRASAPLYGCYWRFWLMTAFFRQFAVRLRQKLHLLRR